MPSLDVGKRLLRRSISKQIEDYEQFNDGFAALLQLRQEGKEGYPGEAIRYIITDGDSRDERTRMMVEALADDDVQYDAEAYIDLFVRAAETLFLPFGYTREKLLEKSRDNGVNNINFNNVLKKAVSNRKNYIRC